MVIVEDKAGKRFPVLKDMLTSEHVNEAGSADAPALRNKIPKRSPVSTKQAGPLSSLF